MNLRQSETLAEVERGDEPSVSEGWIVAPLGAITTNFDGTRIPVRATDRSKRRGQYPYYGASGIIDSIDDYLFDGDFLLIAEDGANLLSRSTPIAFRASGKFWVNNHAHVVQTRCAVPLDYLQAFLNGMSLEAFVTGSAQPKLTQEALNSILVMLAPLAEQQRIVTKIESLMAQVSQSREHLSRVPAILKRFRQAVLTAACSGKLTEDWRESNAPNESVDEFLQRILIERKSRWERGKYRKPNHSGDENADTDVPDTWRWCSFDTFVTDSLYGPRFSANVYSNEGIPTIRTTDIDSHGRIVFRDPPRLSLSAPEASELCLHDGDLLVTRSGSIGKCAMYESAVGPAIPSAYLIRFRVTRDALPPAYLLLFLMSPSGQELLRGGATSVTQSNVNAVTISQFPVPLPPRAEITVILRRARTLLAFADAIEHRVSAAVSHAEKLSQSILAKAFRGELVPTEAELARREGRDYEPASVLLERIKKEREEQTATKPKQQRRRRKAEMAAVKG
jgi:type I restriction enzyme, S subunit